LLVDQTKDAKCIFFAKSKTLRVSLINLNFV